MQEFKIVSVSSNYNAFGLYGVIMVTRDGEAWEVAMNGLNKPKKGDVRHGNPRTMGEIPRQLQSPDSKTLKAIWL